MPGRSVAWVLNGWFLFLPSGNEELDYLMSSITAVIGGSLFWIGAYLSVVEAVNTDQKVSLLLKCCHFLLQLPGNILLAFGSMHTWKMRRSSRRTSCCTCTRQMWRPLAAVAPTAHRTAALRLQSSSQQALRGSSTAVRGGSAAPAPLATTAAALH